MARSVKPFITALIVVCLAPLPVFAEAEGDDDANSQAREHYERGRVLEDEGDMMGAYQQYERANELRPSYRIQRHLGRVSRGLGRYRDALDHFQTFLDEGGERVTAEDREAVSSVLVELGELVTSIRVVVPDGTEIYFDGQRVAVAPMSEPIRRDPGPLNLELRLEGHTAELRELELEPGESRTIEISLQPLTSLDEDDSSTPALLESSEQTEASGAPPDQDQLPNPRRRLSPAIFWSTAALSAALFVASGVTGRLALSSEADFERLDDPYRNDEQDEELVAVGERGDALAVATDVLLATGAAAAVTALVLVFFTRFERRRSTTSRRFQVTATPTTLLFGGSL